MKTKKCLTILLTLALVLSIAAVAFAAEKSGAAPAAVHICNVILAQEVNDIYAYKNASQHTYHRQVSQYCPSCQMIVNDDSSLTTYSHLYTVTQLGSYEDSGETAYYCLYECRCGDVYIR